MSESQSPGSGAQHERHGATDVTAGCAAARSDVPTQLGDRAAASFHSALLTLAQMPEKTPLRKADLRILFGVSSRTLQRWVAAGEIPPPIPLGRWKIWTAGTLLNHLHARAESEAAKARQRRAVRSEKY